MKIELVTANNEHVAYVKPAVHLGVDDPIVIIDQVLIWGTRMFLYARNPSPDHVVFSEVMPTVVIEDW